MDDESQEMYLKVIFEIEESGEEAHTTGIAARLEIAPASVTEMLAKLKKKGLVNHVSYGSARLTRKGKFQATKIIRKFRLLEKCLPMTLGISAEKATEEACRLEHALSDELDQRICQILGRPTLSIHNKPIPHCTKPISCERCLKSAPGLSNFAMELRKR